MSKETTQEDVTNYVVGTLYGFPSTPRSQIEAMVILHYDIPNAKAKKMVGLALVKALEVFRRTEKVKSNELNQLRTRIDTLIEMTPEYNST